MTALPAGPSQEVPVRDAPEPGAGAFASGHTDTAQRAEEVLARTGFGGAPGARRRTPRKPAT